MKKFLPLCLVCCYIIAATTLFSCSKDDDDTTSAYITEQQLLGTWQHDSQDYHCTYTFTSPNRVTMHSTYNDTYYGWQEQNYSGSFYLEKADQHLLGIYYWTGAGVANGAQKANYESFEWLNSQHTQFSLGSFTFIKQ